MAVLRKHQMMLPNVIFKRRDRNLVTIESKADGGYGQLEAGQCSRALTGCFVSSCQVAMRGSHRHETFRSDGP